MHVRRGNRRPRFRIGSHALMGLAVSCLVTMIGVAPVPADQRAAGVVDDRERILVPAPVRNTVLAEMRGMLASMNGVLAGLAEGDTAAAAEAARSSGMSHAADVMPEVAALLPDAFKQLGVATHRGFDALADELEASGSPQESLAALAGLTQNCVACHATYRMDEAP